MTLAEMYDRLHDAGFDVTATDGRRIITVSLNRPISKLEVLTALGMMASYACISRIDANTIVVTE